MFFITKTWIKEIVVGYRNHKMRDFIVYKCPHCNRQSIVQYNYCPDCGRKLKKAK